MMQRFPAVPLTLTLLCVPCIAETDDNALTHAEALIALSDEKTNAEYLQTYASYDTGSIAESL